MVLQYVAAGCLAMEVQRKANKLKVSSLFDNFLCNPFGLCYQLPHLILYQQQIDHHPDESEPLQSSIWIFCSPGQQSEVYTPRCTQHISTGNSAICLDNFYIHS